MCHGRTCATATQDRRQLPADTSRSRTGFLNPNDITNSPAETSAAIDWTNNGMATAMLFACLGWFQVRPALNTVKRRARRERAAERTLTSRLHRTIPPL